MQANGHDRVAGPCVPPAQRVLYPLVHMYGSYIELYNISPIPPAVGRAD